MSTTHVPPIQAAHYDLGIVDNLPVSRSWAVTFTFIDTHKGVDYDVHGCKRSNCVGRGLST